MRRQATRDQEQTWQRVDDVIEDYFDRRIARASSLGHEHAALWHRAARAARGGKRLRPRLVLRTHELLDGTDEHGAAVVAAAFEILHTALLLHDDVLDGDLVRRGRPNLAGEFAADALDSGADPARATAWGAASGLLVGDLLLSGVHALIAQLASPARAELHDIVDDCLLSTAAGEHADVGLSLGVLPPEPTGIRRMMEHKTAAYSFAAPLRAGAVLAGADLATAHALAAIGTALGLLYQLRDDVLGVFGIEERTGKTVLGDLREGKRTLLIACAVRHPEWQEVSHLFGRRSLEEVDAARLRSVLLASGAVAEHERLIARQRARVDQQIQAADLPERLRDELRATAGLCAERDA